METNTLLALAGGIILLFAWKRFGPGHAASRAEILEKISKGATIVDVRSAGEFSTGAYPKARNVPLDLLESRMEKLGAKDKSLVVYCASGSRSAQAARLLKAAGFTDVTNAGGLAGMPR